VALNRWSGGLAPARPERNNGGVPSHPTNGTRLPAIKLALATPLRDVPSLLALASDALDAAAAIADDLDSQERIVAAAAVVGVLPGGPGLPIALAESLLPHRPGGFHGRPATHASSSPRRGG
jgi:hypothetical protein